MKRTLAFIIILIISLGQCFSQKQYHFGISASAGRSHYNVKPEFNDIHEYTPEKCYSLGIIGGLTFNSNIFLETGLNFSKDGYSINYTWNVEDPNDPAIPERTVFQGNYLHMPLSIGYRFFSSNKLQVSPLLGPYLLYLLSSDEESQFMDGSIRESEFASRNMKKLSIGLRLGVRVDYNAFSTVNIGLEPFVHKSLTSIDQLVLESGHITYGISVVLSSKQ